MGSTELISADAAAMEAGYVLASVFTTRFENPKAIAVDGHGAVYVGCGGFVGGVQQFTPSAAEDTYVSAWEYGAGLESYAVRGMALAPSGELLLTVNTRREAGEMVQVFSSTGDLLTCWDSRGEDAGQFRAPTGIACDDGGHIYLGEAVHKSFGGGNRIHRFDAHGVWQMCWGRGGQRNGEFNLPTGIALDGQGNVHVADTYNSRVQVFAPDGTFLATWGLFGPDAGQLNCPQGIAFDRAGNYFIADTGNNRIQQFSPDGERLACWGRRGTGAGEFWLPCGIAVDGEGSVYVADTINNRVQVFRRRTERTR